MALLDVHDGGKIYFEHVPGDRHTVLLSHGWGMSGRVWDKTAAFLVSAGWGVLRYDHRCCGESDKDFQDGSIEALGRDIEALCDAAQLDSVVLSGWSLGGAAVVEAAARLGSRVHGLVLTGGATPRYTRCESFPYGGEEQDVEATLTALRADRGPFLRGLYYDSVFAKDVGDAVKEWAWQIAMQAGPGADASLAALAQLDQRETLRSFELPALVVIGTEDGVVAPDIGRAAAEMLQGARLVEFKGCGHAVFLEAPDAYHRELASFLSEL